MSYNRNLTAMFLIPLKFLKTEFGGNTAGINIQPKTTLPEKMLYF